MNDTFKLRFFAVNNRIKIINNATATVKSLYLTVKISFLTFINKKVNTWIIILKPVKNRIDKILLFSRYRKNLIYN